MQSNRKDPSVNNDSSKCKQNPPTDITTLAVRNMSVGLAAGTVFHPLNLWMQAIYSRALSGNGPKILKSPQASALGVGFRAAAWHSYKSSVTLSTVKCTTKQQSQGAKSYLLDEKVQQFEEIDPKESVTDIVDANSQYKGLTHAATALGASLAFGGAEALITNSSANTAVLSNENLLAKTQGRTFDLPELTTRAQKRQYRQAGLPVRVAKSSGQVFAFMATDGLDNSLAEKGYENSKLIAIGVVSTTFGLGINLTNRIHTEQIITMEPNTLKVKNTKEILKSMIARSGPRTIFLGSGMSIVGTGLVQTIVPFIENAVDKNVIPKKQAVHARAKHNFRLFTQTLGEKQLENQKREAPAVKPPKKS